VDLDWLFDRIREDPGVYIKFVGTKEQIADLLTKGSFTASQWQSLCKLAKIGPSPADKQNKSKHINVSPQPSEAHLLKSCFAIALPSSQRNAMELEKAMLGPPNNSPILHDSALGQAGAERDTSTLRVGQNNTRECFTHGAEYAICQGCRLCEQEVLAARARFQKQTDASKAQAELAAVVHTPHDSSVHLPAETEQNINPYVDIKSEIRQEQEDVEMGGGFGMAETPELVNLFGHVPGFSFSVTSPTLEADLLAAVVVVTGSR
jgi:hypothetical protein